MIQNENKAGIYIHVPFCKQACSYCNFHFSTSFQLKEAFVKSLVKELEMRKNYLGNSTIQSIYFGGGTPSVLTSEESNFILNAIYKVFPVDKNAEITLEANPDDLAIVKLNELKISGFNRLSIGIQSFFDRDLIMMNRIHNSIDAERSLQNSIDAGFDNITADLIYGIPGQSNVEWEMNINTLLKYKIDHISCYALTVEPKTAMQHLIQKKKMLAPDEAQTVEQFEILVDLLTSNNFEHYEISNFARDKKYSLHNSSYWFGNKYLGAGPSAHSFDNITRQWNASNNSAYIEGINNKTPIYEIETLTETQQKNELLMTSLRTMWGLNINHFIEKYGIDCFEQIKKEGAKYHVVNYLEIVGDNLIITPKGKFISDKIISDLFFTD